MTISEQAVQAAARALCRFGTSFSTIEATNSWVDEKWPRFKEEATLALTAAAPHLAQVRVKKLEDWQLDQILTGVKSQVNHNGWEEPYVRNRLRHELERILSALEPS